MRASRIGYWAWVFLLAGGLAPAGAAADDVALDETQRWIPSFAITSGIIAQGGKATAVNQRSEINPGTGRPFDFERLSWSADDFKTSSNPLGCWNGENPPPTNPPANTPACPGVVRQPVPYPNGGALASGSRVLFAPLVGGNLELMTPGISSLPGRPRGFIQAGVEASFGFDYSVAQVGKPGDMGSSVKPKPQELSSVQGQGSATFAEIASPLYFAGAGVAFTAEVLGRRIRIKPSFEWMSQQVKVRGETHFAVQLNGGGNLTEIPYQLLYMGAEGKLKLNGIGPGLELEIDTVRLGPFMLSLGIFGRAYHYLGNLDVTISDSAVVGPQSAVGLGEEYGNPIRRTDGTDVTAWTAECISLVGTNQNIANGCRTVLPTSLGNTPVPGTNVEPTEVGGSQPVEASYTYSQKPWGFRAGVALRFRFQPE